MENVVLKENKNFSKLLMFLFLKFNFKKILKSEIKYGKYFNVLYLPSPDNLGKKNKIKYFKRLITFMEKSGIKNIYCGKINEDLKGELRKKFLESSGENIFFDKFSEILDFFAKKKGINLTLNEVCFISNDSEIVKRLIFKCEKKVKSFSVLTENYESFKNLKEKLADEKGIFLKINEKKKKINTIYINCEKSGFIKEDLFVKSNMLDIYKVYKNTFNNVKLFYKSKNDEFIKENKIEKNIVFTDFFIKCLKDSSETVYLKNFLDPQNFKIINIKK